MLPQLLIPLLAVFGAVASPAPTDAVRRAGDVVSKQSPSATDSAAKAVRRAQAEHKKWNAAKRKVDARYKRQLAEIDKLKRRRSSWRRDRELRTAYAESQSTAKRLAEFDRRARTAARRLKRLRGALVDSLTRELATTTSPDRRATLIRLRAEHRPKQSRRRRIVLPDDRIDPLASSTELEEQAQLLAKSEAQLAREIESLSRREKRYLRMAKLRRTRARAAEMGLLDDNNPRRTTGRTGRASTGGGGVSSDSDAEGATAPAEPGGGSPAPPAGGGDDSNGVGFESGDSSDRSSADYAIILADIVDTPTLNAYRTADQSGDPTKKAAAARRMRKQARKRLERLRRQRKQMLNKASQLRR